MPAGRPALRGRCTARCAARQPRLHTAGLPSRLHPAYSNGWSPRPLRQIKTQDALPLLDYACSTRFLPVPTTIINARRWAACQHRIAPAAGGRAAPALALAVAAGPCTACRQAAGALLTHPAVSRAAAPAPPRSFVRLLHHPVAAVFSRSLSDFYSPAHGTIDACPEVGPRGGGAPRAAPAACRSRSPACPPRRRAVHASMTAVCYCLSCPHLPPGGGPALCRPAALLPGSTGRCRVPPGLYRPPPYRRTAAGAGWPAHREPRPCTGKQAPPCLLHLPQVVGLINRSGYCQLNPPPDRRVQRGDDLILLRPERCAWRPRPAALSCPPARGCLPAAPPAAPRCRVGRLCCRARRRARRPRRSAARPPASALPSHAFPLPCPAPAPRRRAGVGGYRPLPEAALVDAGDWQPDRYSMK